mmetsp:Transcript_38094/g.58122  ORF Transcript_38094/g.58122 Transcript_38094/m.58122 type:complete len:90 (-) Transcript_38094:655-924(-)
MKTKHALFVGTEIYNEKMPKHEREHLLMERLYVYSAYVTPGQHSVFVYEPQEDKFFTKSVMVDMPTALTHAQQLQQNQKLFFETFKCEK